MRRPAITMVMGNTYWLFIYNPFYLAFASNKELTKRAIDSLKGERVRHAAHIFGQNFPIAGVELDLADAVVVFIFKRAVFLGVLVDFVRYRDIGQAILHYFVFLALRPPVHGLKAVACFAAAERCLRDRLELEPAAQDLAHLFEKVDAFNLGEVARVVL